MPAAPAPPTVLCLLLAECIHISGDRRANILGVFNGYTSATFPATMPKTWVYMAMTDGHGAPTLTLRLVGDESLPPLFTRDLIARFSSPLEVREAVVELPPIPLPAPGVYRWQVLCGGEVLHERRLVVGLAG